MKTYSDEGIVIAKINYGEADRIIALYTKTNGKMFYIAKGVRKMTSRKRGGLEMFNRLYFMSTKSRGLGMITEIEAIADNIDIRQDLKKISVAYFFCEAIGRITREEEGNAEMYTLLSNYLEELKSCTKLKLLRDAFTKSLLANMGFWPKGRELNDPDKMLEEVVERNISSVRVGKKVLADG